MTVLGIDTSTARCAVALVSGGTLLAAAAAASPQAHAEKLLSIIDECLLAGGVRGGRPDAVAVASGPGSFTGLRIGFSTAKGICFARGSALVLVPTFDAWAHAVSKDGRVPPGGPMLAVMPAARDEAYAALFRRTESGMEMLSAPAVFATAGLPALAAGPGSPAVLTDDPVRAAAWFPGLPAGRIVSVAGGNPAVSVALLGERMHLSGSSADLRSAEPAYVKEFLYKVQNGQGA